MAPRPTILTLSPIRRRFYFRLAIAIFVLAVPFIFLYATGYRFESLTGLMSTGGIYVGAEQSDASIYIDGELVHETGTFRRAFYVEGLKPGSYTVTVSKEEYQPWEKKLEVHPHKVTEAQAFNMPKDPLLVLIPPTFVNQTPNATSTATSTDSFLNPVYEKIEAAFSTTMQKGLIQGEPRPPARDGKALSATASSTQMATTTKEFRGMQLYDEGRRIVARWIRDTESMPFYLCVQEGICIDKVVLNTTDEKASYFDFFPGTSDLAIVTLEDGVYVIELDNRSAQNIQPLFPTPGADFRIIDGGIYVKTADDAIYKVEI